MSVVTERQSEQIAAANGKPPAHVRIEFITPDKAAKLLKLNTHNRDLRAPRVKQLAGAIKRGEWHLNGDAIVLSGTGEETGVLYNGQHRLYAIIDAQTGVWMVVLYNVDAGAQETMDSGLTRSFGAKLKLRGEKFYNELAASLRLAWTYDTTASPEMRNANKPTDQQLFDYLSHNPSIREALANGQALRREFLSPGGSWGGWVYLFRREVGDQLADTFVDRLISGAQLADREPIFVLRRLLLKQRTTTAERRFGSILMGAHIVKAFNAYCLGQEMRILKWDDREEFPKIVTSAELDVAS